MGRKGKKACSENSLAGKMRLIIKPLSHSCSIRARFILSFPFGTSSFVAGPLCNEGRPERYSW